jgi:ketosteroid isomerase-like protein
VHPNKQLLTDFYDAFARRDGAAMERCYATNAHFEDAVFSLDGADRIGGMWRMLCERGQDLRVEASHIDADDERGSAHWDAWYTFSATGRKVGNRIDATFRFADGKIVDHRDAFSFWRWSRQALGPAGLLLGWTPLVRAKVRRTAAANLDAYLASRPAGAVNPADR